MTSRKRRAESISSLSPISSGSESEDVESRVYLQQDEILKPTSTGLEEDEYPIYLLEDATVYSLDGENIENLLEVDVRGRVQVRGRLTISADDSEISHLRSPKYNGQWVAFTSEAFSIGWGPSVIWALGHRKWFEIQPSFEYLATYAKITEGIAIYYYFTELYEQLAKQLAKQPIDKILLKYAQIEGNNLTADAVREKIKSHAGFLLAQMSKRGGKVNWISTKFFKWLAAESPDIHRAVLQKNNLLPAFDSNAPEGTSKAYVPTRDRSRFERTTKDPTHLASSSAVTERSRRHITTMGATSTADVIARTMQELLKSTRTPDKITIATVWTALYHDMQLNLAQARVIVRCHAQKILALLPVGVWENSQVFKDLTLEVAFSDPSSKESKNWARALSKMSDEDQKAHAKNEIQREKESNAYSRTAMSIKLEARKSVVDRKKPVRKAGGISAVSDANRLISPFPESEVISSNPYGVKSLPTFPRGKNATLRPTSTVTTQYVTDYGSSRSDKPDRGNLSGNSARGQKRKAMEPEMGESSDNETPWEATDEVFQDQAVEGANEDANYTLELVNIQLPSTEPTGPNGSWVCPKADCSMVIHDSRGEEGKLTIRQHQYSHVDPVALEYLVQKEARERGVQIEYLLERVRGMGATKRMQDEKEQSQKLQTVQPIKRAGI